MQKYFDVMNANDFFKALKWIKKFDIVVLQPKYDGSNILKFGDSLYTRNLNPVPTQWYNIIKSKFPEILKSKYNFYFEFGGKLNAPAGYKDCWSDDWDYRVFDFYEYRYPLDDLKREGLRVVETIGEYTDVVKAIETAVRVLSTPEYRKFEGIVVKVYGVGWQEKNKRPFSVLFGKVKHDNVGSWVAFLENMEGSEKEKTEIPIEEIRHHLHKILVEKFLTKGKDVSLVSLDAVWNDLDKELSKHGYKLTIVHKETVRTVLKELKRDFKKMYRNNEQTSTMMMLKES